MQRWQRNAVALKIKYYCPAMHSSGPLIAMLATKFNCFPLYLPRRGNKSIRWRKKSEFSCCTNTIFLAAEKYNAQGCKIAKAKTPSGLEPCPCSCKSSSICHVDKLNFMTNCKSRIIGYRDHHYHKNDFSDHHHHDPDHPHHCENDEIANGRQVNM